MNTQRNHVTFIHIVQNPHNIYLWVLEEANTSL